MRIEQFTRAATAGIAAALLLMAGGCDRWIEGSITNETSESLSVILLGEDGTEYPVMDLLPGQALPAHGIFSADTNCTTLPLVALTDQGQQMATQEPPFCDGDEWIIRDHAD